MKQRGKYQEKTRWTAPIYYKGKNFIPCFVVVGSFFPLYLFVPYQPEVSYNEKWFCLLFSSSY